jgi:hypothetical protein
MLKPNLFDEEQNANLTVFDARIIHPGGGGLCTKTNMFDLNCCFATSVFLCRSIKLKNVKGYELETNLYITCSFKSEECQFGCGSLLFSYFSCNYIVTCRPVSR